MLSLRSVLVHAARAVALSVALLAAFCPSALAGAPPQTVVEKNIDGVTRWLYWNLRPQPLSAGAVPGPCEGACAALWEAQAELDSDDNQVVLELLELGYRSSLFSGFSDGLVHVSQTSGHYIGTELGATDAGMGVFPTHVGVEAVHGPADVLVQRRNVGDLLATTSWGGGPYSGSDEIRAPTFGYAGPSWGTGCASSGTPPTSPGPDFIVLTAASDCPGYDWTTGTWFLDTGERHMWFAPLQLDGAPAGVSRGYSDNQNLVNWRSTDPGFTVARGAALTQLRFYAERYPALIAWIAAHLQDPDYLARQFRPKLRFDEGEKWRPVNVDSFLSEQNPINGHPVQCVGLSRATCEPVTSAETLREHYSSADRIFQNDWYTSGEANDSGDYRTTDTTCELEPSGADAELQDCDAGPAATIYYNALTRSAGYDYLDYWFFYRFNEFALDDHEADWEHVTVAPSLSDPTTFDWVQFSQHDYTSEHSTGDDLGGDYLRDLLQCDGGGEGSCGHQLEDQYTGQRVWDYVAGGTHANYPDECTDFCAQPGILTAEGDHGGEAPWSVNDDPAALVPFPAPVGWISPSSGNWTDWPGKWGEQGIPASPGNNRLFKCPWDNNSEDATACSARALRIARASAVTASGSRCDTWYGSGIAAAACTPSKLKSAMRRGHVGRRGNLRLTLPNGHRVASANGIAQAAGSGLRPGQSIVVRGRRSADVEVLVRARYAGAPRQWKLRGLRPGTRPVTITVPARKDGTPRIRYS